MTHANFNLQRDAYGRLVFLAENGIRHEGVTPVRAFPIAAPDEGISLVNYEGHEVAWADRLADLPPAVAQLIAEELASREFVPEIECIAAVSGFACGCGEGLEGRRKNCQRDQTRSGNRQCPHANANGKAA